MATLNQSTGSGGLLKRDLVPLIRGTAGEKPLPIIDGYSRCVGSSIELDNSVGARGWFGVAVQYEYWL